MWNERKLKEERCSYCGEKKELHKVYDGDIELQLCDECEKDMYKEVNWLED